MDLEQWMVRAEHRERMSRRISWGLGSGYGAPQLVENFSLTHLSLVNSKKDIFLDILLDIPRYMYQLFSVFGSEVYFSKWFAGGSMQE